MSAYFMRLARHSGLLPGAVEPHRREAGSASAQAPDIEEIDEIREVGAPRHVIASEDPASPRLAPPPRTTAGPREQPARDTAGTNDPAPRAERSASQSEARPADRVAGEPRPDSAPSAAPLAPVRAETQPEIGSRADVLREVLRWVAETPPAQNADTRAAPPERRSAAARPGTLPPSVETSGHPAPLPERTAALGVPRGEPLPEPPSRRIEAAPLVASADAPRRSEPRRSSPPSRDAAAMDDRLDLSIGSIQVSIEAPAAPQPRAASAPAPPPAREPPPLPRLRRHYL